MTIECIIMENDFLNNFYSRSFIFILYLSILY